MFGKKQESSKSKAKSEEVPNINIKGHRSQRQGHGGMQGASPEVSQGALER